MEFGKIGELLREAFRNYFSGDRLYTALKWGVSIQSFDMGLEAYPIVSYTEEMSMGYSEPYPRSTTQLRLDYKIIQDSLHLSPEQAEEFGARAFREREPKHILETWTEVLTLSKRGCFHGQEGLIYTSTNNRIGDFPSDDTLRNLGELGDHPSVIVEDRHFCIFDKYSGFRSVADVASQKITDPEHVVSAFVDRWAQGYMVD